MNGNEIREPDDRETTHFAERPRILERQHLQLLLDALHRRGFTVVGPTVEGGAIVYDTLTSACQLPCGWADKQSAGSYRLEMRNDDALFANVLGPHSWKKFLSPPILRLWRGERKASGFKIEGETEAVPALAFLGVRPCELQAIAIQDRVFTGGAYVDSVYQSRREKLFIAAVNCSHPGGTCFCGSMGTGPKACQGFDIALTEILSPDRHYFVVEIGSPRGAEIFGEIESQEASPAEVQAAVDVSDEAGKRMGRTLETAGIQQLFYRNYENPLWDTVASRCLACANCTLVCPTCFCMTIEDSTDLTGKTAERWRKWDSCFTLDFSYIHGGSVRGSIRARYRQWLTHKLATWIDQFGTSGCVGCGRCITWCPVAIDITEEARALRESEITRVIHPASEDDDNGNA